METNNNLFTIVPNRLNIPLNVGFVGGDLPARYFAGVAVLCLTIVALPPLQFSYSTVKIGALIASMCGTILLMAGLVFSQKTHFAGLMLIGAAFMMMGLAGWNMPWLAVLLGMMILGMIGQNLINKRCGINKLFGVNSCSR